MQLNLPKRPGYGSHGTPVRLITTYFELLASDNISFYRYFVDVDGKHRKSTHIIITTLLREYFSSDLHLIATDHKSILISCQKLPIRQSPYVIKYEQTGVSGSTEDCTCEIKLKLTGLIKNTEIVENLARSGAWWKQDMTQDMTQALNIILGYHARTSPLVLLASSKRLINVDSDNISLGPGLKAVRGLTLSVRNITAPRLLVNVHTTHSVLYEAGNLAWFMMEHLHHHGLNLEKLGLLVKTMKIKTTHGTRRVGSITDFATPSDGGDSKTNPHVPSYGASSVEVLFSWKRAGQQLYISVRDYFHQSYGLHLGAPHLPVLNIGRKDKPVYIPPELCEILPGQICSVNLLSTRQRQRMLAFARQSPENNIISTVSAANRVLKSNSPFSPGLSAFNLVVESKLMSVPGRVLESPAILFRDNKTVRTTNGSWKMRTVKLSVPATVRHWTYLWVSNGELEDAWSSEKELQCSLHALRETLLSLGVNVRLPFLPGSRVVLRGVDEESMVENSIQRFIRQWEPPPFLVIILRGVDDPIYNYIKFICEVRLGIQNICVAGHNLARARENDTFCMNMSLKMNLKLGGSNQHLHPSKLGFISHGKTLVVGIDVTHPSPNDPQNVPSIAAVVASIDASLTQWPGEISIQKGRKEMVSNLADMIKRRLKLWADNNGGFYPDNILIYRDGVSESQYETVLLEEIPLCQKAWTELHEEGNLLRTKPKITVVIAGKRHHTRFFIPGTKARPSSNPLNGTVVDHIVTDSKQWSFYLQSHSASQGVARPVHYFVAMDEILRTSKLPSEFRNPAEYMEAITHNMCYLFGRCNSAVSVCPPVFYAHLACTRGRVYLDGMPDGHRISLLADCVSERENQAGSEGCGNLQVHENILHTMFYV